MDKLFEFHLRSLDEIEPWIYPKNNSRYLSWFGLSDGLYRLKVGDEFLFNITEEMRSHWAGEYPNMKTTLVDYQVVRLWEDVLEMLPDVLSPLPDDLFGFFETQNLSFAAWGEVAEQWLDKEGERDVNSPEMEIFEQAVGWLRNRHLDAAYLRYGPNIWMWSHGETVTITWDACEKIGDLQVWSTQRGSFSMSRTQFLNHVRGFHEEFISQMEKRVDDVCRNWNRADVFIDLPALRREQLERSDSFRKALEKVPAHVDWAKVMAGMVEIRK